MEQTPLTAAGLANDRSWMIVTPAGRFLTQRELPRLALIRPRLTDTEFVLDAPACDSLVISLYDHCNRVPVVVWGDTCPAFDAGDVAAAWLQAFLERECRLVRFDPDHRRLSSRAWTGELEAENRFSDGFPVLIIGQASLADLNSRLERPLPMNRFRPNIVVEGLAAYDEDRIAELYDDTVTLRLVKACTRCKITTTDQETAGLDGEAAADPEELPLRRQAAWRHLWSERHRGARRRVHPQTRPGSAGTLEERLMRPARPRGIDSSSRRV